MTLEQANFIKNALLNNNIETEIIEDYSGRGMNGAKTYGVTFFTSFGNLIPAVINHTKETVDSDGYGYDEVPDFGILRYDNMGHGFILY